MMPHTMKCPFCGHLKIKVVETRKLDGGQIIRRRRQCLKCGERFTSYEQIEEKPLLVTKKDGRKEQFNRAKIRAGILRACEKRPVSIKQIEKIIDEVEKKLHQETGREVKTSRIGEEVMLRLRKMDQVAYVRFASVYRKFGSVKDFIREINKMED